GHTEAEINRMRDEAKANEASDKAERERVDKINSADSMVFQTEKNLKDYGDKIPAEKRSAIESSLTALKDAHKSQDVAAIDKAMEQMNAAWHAASEDMAKAAQSGPAPGADAGAGFGGQDNGSGNGSAGNGDQEVTDVDFEEVK
ncbi:MAG: Hsp70 family protein, partial [Bacteroidales bacterium]|nr:Hsp70 family protein [Bacteroidales bacterium]